MSTCNAQLALPSYCTFAVHFTTHTQYTIFQAEQQHLAMAWTSSGQKQMSGVTNDLYRLR